MPVTTKTATPSSAGNTAAAAARKKAARTTSSSNSFSSGSGTSASSSQEGRDGKGGEAADGEAAEEEEEEEEVEEEEVEEEEDIPESAFRGGGGAKGAQSRERARKRALQVKRANKRAYVKRQRAAAEAKYAQRGDPPPCQVQGCDGVAKWVTKKQAFGKVCDECM